MLRLASPSNRILAWWVNILASITKCALAALRWVCEDSRLYTTTGKPRGVVDTISDNAANAGVIVGERKFAPDEIDMRWVSALLIKNDVVEETGVVAGVLNHLANGVAWLWQHG